MKRFGVKVLPVFAFATFVATSSAQAASPAETEADEYMQTWEDRGREACKDNERGCAAAGHALDRAAADYEKAGKLAKAITIRKMIMDPQWHLDYTDYGRMAAFTLARNYQSVAEYGQSASLNELAVRRFAKSDEAPDALWSAILLRLALGESDQAIDDLQLFEKNYGIKRAADVPRIVVAIATKFWEHGGTTETMPFLEKWMATIDRDGDVHSRALAHALAGRSHAQEGATAKAAAEFEIVRVLWASPYDAVKQIIALGGSEEEQNRRLVQTLTVVAEALFFFAEQKRAEVEAIHFPAYAGPGDKSSVLLFVDTKVSEWLKKKNTAIEEADHEYQKILNVQPAPPPRWVIAAGERVGILWSTFVSEFHRAPTPKEWKSSTPLPGTSMTGTEMKKLYLAQLSSLSEPYMERSKRAFRVCVEYSTRYQYVDEHSRSCVAWLEKHYPKEWIPFDEIKPGTVPQGWSIRTSLVTPNP
jgi:tetratricopeptide (TPR) repeat protein